MKNILRDLFRMEGTVDRGPYLLVGVLGFAIKHNLDRLVAAAFGRQWGLFNYWIPLDKAVRLTALSRTDALFLLTLVVLALPFIWVGVVLTLKRLRSIGWPSWPVVFFFAPFANLLFFLLLSLLPARPAGAQEPRPAFLRRLIPDSKLGSAAMAILIALLLGLGATLLSTTILARYGWGLFVALPFCLGLTATLLYGYHRPRSMWSCVAVSLAPIGLLAGALLALAFEGVYCIAMAAPIAVPLAGLGGWVGYLIQRRAWAGAQVHAMLVLILLSIPALMGAEYALAPQPPQFQVTTTIEISAPPDVVWTNVIAFSELPPPKEWYFRSGIAYPMRAQIEGRGPGAVRYCIFSTGAFVEPIETWDAPRLLQFAVAANPAPLREFSPFAEVHPPHLSGYFVSKKGQFHLVPLPGGRTRLEGTTWYQHSLWPASYWRLWSDAIIHRIHWRVLRHIRMLSEQENAGKKGERQ